MIFNTRAAGVPRHQTYKALPRGEPPYVAPINRDHVAAAAFIDDPKLLDAQNSAYLDSCLETATMLAWNMTGFEADARQVTLHWSGDNPPVTGLVSAWIDLAVYPVQSIDSVTLVDFNGNETVGSVQYLDTNSLPPRVMLSNEGLNGEIAAIRLVVNVGSTDAAQRDPYALAVGKLAAHLFINRAAGDPSPMSGSGVQAILRRYKVGGPL